MINLIVFKRSCHIFILFVNKKLCIFQDIGLQLRGLLASVDEFLQHTSQSGFEEVMFCDHISRIPKFHVDSHLTLRGHHCCDRMVVRFPKNGIKHHKLNKPII